MIIIINYRRWSQQRFVFLETTGGDRKATYIQISYGVTIYQKGIEWS